MTTAQTQTADATTDLILDRLLPCGSKRAYELALGKLAEELAVGQPDDGKRRDGDPLNRRLWAVVTRYRGRSYAPGARASRGGLPLTWAEVQVVRYATTVMSDGVIQRPDVGHICNVLQRPAAEVEAAMRRYGPAQGRAGFGLGGLQ